MGGDRKEQSLWERFKSAVAKLWCRFVTIAVLVLVWGLIAIGVYYIATWVISIGVTIVFVAAPTGPLDVLIMIAFVIFVIILIYLLIKVLIEIWGWSKEWIDKRVRICD